MPLLYHVAAAACMQLLGCQQLLAGSLEDVVQGTRDYAPVCVVLHISRHAERLAGSCLHRKQQDQLLSTRTNVYARCIVAG